MSTLNRASQTAKRTGRKVVFAYLIALLAAATTFALVGLTSIAAGRNKAPAKERRADQHTGSTGIDRSSTRFLFQISSVQPRT